MLLSELDFGSYLTYSPHGDSDFAKESQETTKILKKDRFIGSPPLPMSQYVAEKIKNEFDNLPFNNFLNSKVSLVPVPKSSLMQKNEFWVPERIAKALANQGLGVYCPCLKRIKAVQKSSTSNSLNRPKPKDHYESIQVQALINKPKEIVIVDDVITTGAHLLACASLLNEVFPDASIKGFAVIRTISNSDEFEKILNPCVGKIILNGEKCLRRP